MDALQVDVTGIPGVELGDWVTLIGTDGGEHISASQLACRAGMTPYQLLSRLACQRFYRSVETHA
jgi:alanine racemase